MRRQVQLYIRVRLPDGSYPHLLAAYAEKRETQAWVGMHQRHAVEFSPCTHHLRYRQGGKRRWEAVGTDASTALVLLGHRTAEPGEADIHHLGASELHARTQA